MMINYKNFIRIFLCITRFLSIFATVNANDGVLVGD